MKLLIFDAINDRNVLEFTYEEQKRSVEPFILGYDKDTNNLVVRAYCMDSGSWPLFEVKNMTDFKVTNIEAEDFREHYKPIDYQMSRIICNL